MRYITNVGGAPTQFDNLGVAMNRTVDTSSDASFVELQHLHDTGTLRAIAGLRYQWGEFDTTALLQVVNPAFASLFSSDPASHDRVKATVERIGAYGYLSWEIGRRWRVTAGAAYDDLERPRNFRQPPIVAGEVAEHKASPKLGLLWQPTGDLVVQALYSHSLGGVGLVSSSPPRLPG